MTKSSRPSLLIVDDEEDMLRLLKRSLSEDLNCDIETAADATRALRLLETNPFDVVLADIRMPGMDGMEFLERSKSGRPDLTVVMMTSYGSIDLAVKAIKKGAYDFIAKPFELDKLILLMEKALERSCLVRENLILQRRIREQQGFQEMVGTSAKIKKVFETIRLISKTDVTVLLTGESGTGKDMAARAIHNYGDRSEGPFVAVNCPNLPENILESELFGYRRGAFTHATQDKKGLFLEAGGGTIYLDEIGEISPTLQTKLLRVLQDKEIRPLGQTASLKIDVRIIASTNQYLERRIKENLFREDLFYRLNVVSLKLPPLRERPEDIPLLVEHFLERYCKDFHRPKKTISVELMNRFISYRWKGNVRELENVIRSCVLLAPGEEIRLEDIEWDAAPEQERFVREEGIGLTYKEAKTRALERFHSDFLRGVLSRHKGNVTRAAKECGLERQSLQQVMRRYGIKAKDIQVKE
ncbi:MAG: sigma-54 dependent transcriptional regulator [Pseudomonadota bacterium]